MSCWGCSLSPPAPPPPPCSWCSSTGIAWSGCWPGPRCAACSNGSFSRPPTQTYSSAKPAIHTVQCEGATIDNKSYREDLGRRGDGTMTCQGRSLHLNISRGLLDDVLIVIFIIVQPPDSNL